jgi:hypothetical protein
MVAMLAWLLRSPLAGVSSFRRAISSTPPEAVFSSMRETHLVPGIGAMSSPASSQANAIYPIFDEASAALDRAGPSCPRISPVQNASPESERQNASCSHNPEVAGSNPALHPDPWTSSAHTLALVSVSA